MKTDNKPYTKVLKENFFPYLISIQYIKNSKHKLKYIFNIHNAYTQDKEYFNMFIQKYGCWKYVGNSNKVSYVTDSVTLRDLYNNTMGRGTRRSAVLELKEEQIADIPKINLVSTPIKKGAVFQQLYEGTLTRNWETLRRETHDHLLDASRHVSVGYRLDTVYTDMRCNQDYKTDFNINANKENNMNDTFTAKFNIDINVNGRDYKLTDPCTAAEAMPVVLQLGKRVKVLKERMTLVTEASDKAPSIVEVFENEIGDIEELIKVINDNVEEVK